MAKIKLPRYTFTTLTAPTTISESGAKLPLPDARSMTMLSAAQRQALGTLATASPRSAQVYPAGSIVITSVDDGGMRVLSPSQYAALFETAPEGSGKVRASSQTLTTVTVSGGTAITTNSDGTVNVGGAGDTVVTNPATGETRLVKAVDFAQNFEST